MLMNGRFVEQVLNPIAAGRYDVVRGSYADVGGNFCCDVYPDGQVERIRPIADFFSVLSYLDDLMDNTVSIREVDAVAGGLADAASGRPVTDPELLPILNLFTRCGMADDLYRLCAREFMRYVRSARELRAVEISRESISVDSYLALRAPNTAVDGFVYGLIGYAIPDLTDQLCAADHTDAFHLATHNSGVAVGLALDLSMVNAERPEITEYVAIDQVLLREHNGIHTRQQAIDAAVRLFHQAERRLHANLTELSRQYPDLAAAMRYVHGGNLVWLARARGRRYSSA